MKKAFLSLASLVLSTFLFSLQLRADSVLTTITVGNGATGIAANPRTNKIYVGGSGQVVVIDGKTQQVIDRITIDTGINANFVAVNVLTNRIYASACNSGACKIAVIDGRNDKVITDISIASGDAIGLQPLNYHVEFCPCRSVAEYLLLPKEREEIQEILTVDLCDALNTAPLLEIVKSDTVLLMSSPPLVMPYFVKKSCTGISNGLSVGLYITPDRDPERFVSQ